MTVRTVGGGRIGRIGQAVDRSPPSRRDLSHSGPASRYDPEGVQSIRPSISPKLTHLTNPTNVMVDQVTACLARGRDRMAHFPF